MPPAGALEEGPQEEGEGPLVAEAVVALVQTALNGWISSISWAKGDYSIMSWLTNAHVVSEMSILGVQGR